MTNNIDQVFNTDNPNTIAEIIVNEVNICIETIAYFSNSVRITMISAIVLGLSVLNT